MGLLLSAIRAALGLWAPIAGYLLAWAVPFAVFGWVFHTVTHPWLGDSPTAIRVGLAGLFQLTVFLVLGAPRPGFRLRGPLPSLAVTLLLVPLVIQPTLTPLRWDSSAWLDRAGHLLDGRASAHLVDSVLGLWRRYEPPAPTPTPEALGDLIAAAADGSARRAALLTAFVAVESAGRRFAVSRTGCVGLMQFCGGTARSRPYREVFGRGRVFKCDCRGNGCKVSAAARAALEAGRFDAPEVAEGFPCVPSDARFDPAKALAAGGLFLDRLESRFGEDLALLYIGYNSGPAVAAALQRQIGPGRAPSEAELTWALRPWFKDGSPARARSLLRVHIPKLRKVYRGALRQLAATYDYSESQASPTPSPSRSPWPTGPQGPPQGCGLPSLPAQSI